MPPIVLRAVDAAQREDTLLRAEYAALIDRAGATILPEFGILRVEGRDRADWLHNLVTAQIETMPEGRGAYSLLLDGKAHVLADFVLLRHPDAFWLYTSRVAHENLYPNLRRAIFREHVTLTDVSDQFGIVTLQGPDARAVAEKIFGAIPPLEKFSFAHVPFGDSSFPLVSNPRAGTTGYDLIVPSDIIPTLCDALVANGATPTGLDALNVARIEAGIPWYGADFDETTLAPEARLDAFIAPDKGCYPGQETIARIRNLGHVNRRLAQFLISKALVPHSGDLIFADDKAVGHITSAVWSFAHAAPLALGYLRIELVVAGGSVQIARGDARLPATVSLAAAF